MKKAFESFVKRIANAIVSNVRAFWNNPKNKTAFKPGHYAVTSHPAKVKFFGAHEQQLHKELQRPYVFMFVPKRKDGALVPSKTVIKYRQPSGNVKSKLHVAFDTEESEWIFNPKLKAAGYKEKNFTSIKPSVSDFSIKKCFHLIYGSNN